jgi:hypothetical protein
VRRPARSLEPELVKQRLKQRSAARWSRCKSAELRILEKPASSAHSRLNPVELVREEAGEAVGAGIGEAAVEAEVGCLWEPLQVGGVPDPGEARVVGPLELNCFSSLGVSA